MFGGKFTLALYSLNNQYDHGAHSLKMLSVFHGMLVVGTDAIRV